MANIIHITDFQDPRLDIYARLTENQLINRHSEIARGAVHRGKS